MHGRILFHVDQLNDQQNTRCTHHSFRVARRCAANVLRAARHAGSRPATVKRGRQWKAGDSIVKLGSRPAPSDRWALVIGCAVALGINGITVAICALCN